VHGSAIAKTVAFRPIVFPNIHNPCHRDLCDGHSGKTGFPLPEAA
jgi:hypothetical protein